MLRQLVVGSVLAVLLVLSLRAKADTACGPIVCTGNTVCCFSGIHPFTYRCIKPGGYCPGNN